MQITKYSKNRLMDTFVKWDVPLDFAEPMFNYLVHGFEPGSCFSALLANNAREVFLHSHPVNTVQAFKGLVGWLDDCCPSVAQGTYAKVRAWIQMPEDQRRAILQEMSLIYTEQEEIVMALKGEPTAEPFFWDNVL